jgi:hypothetical protein
MTAVAITGVHAILISHDVPADRAFLANVLGLASADAGERWRIFALPPAELAADPASADGGGYELYLMCETSKRPYARSRRRARDSAAT